jgi:hypothetical protein
MSERFCVIPHVKHGCDRVSPRSKTILTVPGTQGGAKREREREAQEEVQRIVIDIIENWEKRLFRL